MNSFSESQQFRQWWLWLLLVSSMVVPFVLVYFNLLSIKNINRITDISVGLLVPFLINVLLFVAKLKTKIDSKGIHYQFFPFHLRTFDIEWSEIETAYIRTYRPLPEYGGWGLRAGLGGTGRAYNVSGNLGLQVVLKDGKKILFGTQRANELKQVLIDLAKGKVITFKMLAPL